MICVSIHGGEIRPNRRAQPEARDQVKWPQVKYICTKELRIPPLGFPAAPAVFSWCEIFPYTGIFCTLHLLNWCCYITVDSATAALQKGASIHQANALYKTPFSNNGYMKSLEIYENYITLFWKEKSKVFDNNILTHSHAWQITQSGWNNYLV